ncbi:hypothetical protein [uncultured Secundilactobacillus sp.]|uniref:hypothetical protein n=1 Tax=uncultured Secundilactobacillus sp. TaxID=2813935 RepID=UPI0025867C7E|nr:hypothetical protein [uncultured Secundilactobacillus sp.]
MLDLFLSFLGDLVTLTNPADFQGFWAKKTVPTWLKVLLLLPWYLLNVVTLLISLLLSFSNLRYFGLLGLLLTAFITLISVNSTRIIVHASRTK